MGRATGSNLKRDAKSELQIGPGGGLDRITKAQETGNKVTLCSNNILFGNHVVVAGEKLMNCHS